MGWGECPSCSEPLRALALIPVFRQVVEMTGGGGPPDGQVATSMVLDEVDLALARMVELGGGGAMEASALEATHAINAINYYSSLFPGGELCNRSRYALNLLGANCDVYLALGNVG